MGILRLSFLCEWFDHVSHNGLLGQGGDDVEAYLMEFVRANQMSGWTQAMWAQFLADFLEGMGLAWHKTLPDVIKNDWGAVTDALKRRFGVEEGHSCRGRARLWHAELAGDNTYTCAATRLKHLKLSRYLVGLDSQLRGGCKGKTPRIMLVH